MRSLVHWFYPLLVAVACVPSSSATAQDRTRYERQGERLLTTHCAMCHAVGRIGSSTHPRAPALRDLERRYPLESLAESLAEGLSAGHPEMPKFIFGPNDVAAIINYLRALQQP